MTKSYSFIDIFNSTLETSEGNIKIDKIVIPSIQRDYAQGRDNSDTIKRVRDNFLDALYNAITVKPIVLDFIFGDVAIENETNKFTPLDGQQRLTTLYLIHWYAAKKENIAEEKYKFLINFTYDIRYSSTQFCKYLFSFKPTFSYDSISKEIKNQYWFSYDWEKDQTVKSMLLMLDEIESKFKNIENLWGKLEEGNIKFYILPIKDMGLTDELYIKMNSRGKVLTNFENFKAEFESELRKINNEQSKKIIEKIDKEWTDLLWIYRDENNIIDDYFLRYFNYICDIICYKDNDSTLNKNLDEIDLLNIYFKSDNPNINRNLTILEDYFDCFVNVKRSGINNFFANHISNEHQEGKIKISGEIDLFKDAINNHGIFVKNKKSREFPLSKQILLYGFIVYLCNQSRVDNYDFRRRIRVVNNLINNSSFELSTSSTRDGGNRIPNVLKQVESIILNGTILDNIGNNFNTNQLNEEKEKLIWTEKNESSSETLFRFEDNEFLNGQIAILGLENYKYFDKFNELFKLSLEKIACALLTIGDYGQVLKDIYQYGSTVKSSWIRLFHLSSSKNFNNTKMTLISLLSASESITNDYLDTLINNYIKYCEENNLYDWRYYFIKYEEFRPKSYGKYYWDEDKSNNLYMINVMFTESKVTNNSYSPFLKCVDYKDKISKEFYGKRIIDGNYYIVNSNNYYSIREVNTDKEVDRININQNSEGIDTENRIDVFKKYYRESVLFNNAE